MNPQYSMVIQWSGEDKCYMVFLPDFADRVLQPYTDGATYKEAAKHGQEVIESYVEYWQDEGCPLPEPRTFPQQPLQVA